MTHFLWAAINVNTPTAGGLTGADILGILTILVTIFGLLLTAIGVLVLRLFANLTDRITRSDEARRTDNDAIWRELSLIRSRLFGGRDIPSSSHITPPTATQVNV